MTDAELLERWYVILGIAAILTVAAAALLVTILILARRIAQAALRSHRAVQQIAENTRAIWELDATNAAAWDLRETARSVRHRAEEIAQALQTPAGPRR
jgi:cell division protein FtsB